MVNIYTLNHLYHAVQAFIDFFDADCATLCLKYDNKVIVDICCKNKDNKEVSYKNSGLDYTIDQFLELEVVQNIFPDFISIMVYKHQSFEDFLQMTRKKTSVLKVQQPAMKFLEKKEYAQIS